MEIIEIFRKIQQIPTRKTQDPSRNSNKIMMNYFPFKWAKLQKTLFNFNNILHSFK